MVLKNKVQDKSNKAVSVLQGVIHDLLDANSEADAVIDAQQKEINALSKSNEELDAQRKRNEAIATNIAGLLGE